MAIKITNLQQISDQYAIAKFLYSDVHLDLTNKGSYIPELQQNIDKVDIKVDYDQIAIRNSLRNLFSTRPGQRVLFPEYGLDLHKYLFEAISESTARLIGERIVSAIKRYEPRVVLRQCNVEASPEEQEYNITIIIEYPVFNTTESINTSLDVKSQSFIFA